MKSLSYQGTIPTLAQWQKDSSVMLAIRNTDRILTHLDWLVEYFHKCGDIGLQLVTVADLFFTANSWVQNYHQKNPNINPGRYPAVIALFECVVSVLTAELSPNSTEVLGNNLSVTHHQLLQQLSTMFGSEVTEGGRNVDSNEKKAKYLDSLERKLYRLYFKGGRVYQYPWWAMSKGPLRKGEQRKLSMGSLQLADSKHAYELIQRGVGSAPIYANFGTYVCTLERQFFMARHATGEQGQQNGIYHSSYTRGRGVLGAGSMLIEQGVLKAIRNDSGHYQPGNAYFGPVLQSLEMYGVPLQNVQLFDYRGLLLGSATDYQANKQDHLSWTEFKNRGQVQLAAHKVTNPKKVYV